jgi:hypothetical protein
MWYVMREYDSNTTVVRCADEAIARQVERVWREEYEVVLVTADVGKLRAAVIHGIDGDADDKEEDEPAAAFDAWMLGTATIADPTVAANLEEYAPDAEYWFAFEISRGEVNVWHP